MYCLWLEKQTETLNEMAVMPENDRPAKKGTGWGGGAQKSHITGLWEWAVNALPLPEMHVCLPKGVQSEVVPCGSFRTLANTRIAAPSQNLISYPKATKVLISLVIHASVMMLLVLSKKDTAGPTWLMMCLQLLHQRLFYLMLQSGKKIIMSGLTLPLRCTGALL